MDTRGYENPFASSEEEIGQMDVAVDDEMILRESIRSIILEVHNFECNKHSLGWINEVGEFIDLHELGGLSHGDYMETLNLPPWGVDPYIKVSNANELSIDWGTWDEIEPEQIDGMIDMWTACKPYSRWISQDIETFYVNFIDKDGMEELTVPEFISTYGTREHEDRFFAMLLGEL